MKYCSYDEAYSRSMSDPDGFWADATGQKLFPGLRNGIVLFPVPSRNFIGGLRAPK